jgi:hypothetical protein
MSSAKQGIVRCATAFIEGPNHPQIESQSEPGSLMTTGRLANGFPKPILVVEVVFAGPADLDDLPEADRQSVRDHVERGKNA